MPRNASISSALVPIVLAATLPSPVQAQALLPTEVAADEAAVRLRPDAGWVVDFGEDYCRLQRVFGKGEERHILFMEQIAPSRAFSLTVAGPEFRRFNNQDDVQLGLEGDRAMRSEVSYRYGTMNEFGPALVFETLALGEPGPRSGVIGLDTEAASTIDRIVFQHRKKTVSLETGNMLEPIRVLNKCAQDFLEIWGLDPEAHNGFTAPVLKNEQAFATALQKEYPKKAIKDQESGILTIRLIVDENGRVSDCHTVKLTQSEHLQSVVCKEAGIAQFEPAKDSNGNPISSFYTTRISFWLN